MSASCGIEVVGLTGSSGDTSLAANGTNGNDAIAQNSNSVTVNIARWSPSALTTPDPATEGFGDDKFSVRPATLVGVTAINVNGDDPTASDSWWSTAPRRARHGQHHAHRGRRRHGGDHRAADGDLRHDGRLIYNGQGGNDLLTVTVPPVRRRLTRRAPRPMRPVVQVNSLVPISFTNLGVRRARPCRSPAAWRRIDVDLQRHRRQRHLRGDGLAGPKGHVTLNSQLPVETSTTMTTLTLNGLAGDYRFTVTPTVALPLPYTAITQQDTLNEATTKKNSQLSTNRLALSDKQFGLRPIRQLPIVLRSASAVGRARAARPPAPPDRRSRECRRCRSAPRDSQRDRDAPRSRRASCPHAARRSPRPRWRAG